MTVIKKSGFILFCLFFFQSYSLADSIPTGYGVQFLKSVFELKKESDAKKEKEIAAAEKARNDAIKNKQLEELREEIKSDDSLSFQEKRDELVRLGIYDHKGVDKDIFDGIKADSDKLIKERRDQEAAEEAEFQREMESTCGGMFPIDVEIGMKESRVIDGCMGYEPIMKSETLLSNKIHRTYKVGSVYVNVISGRVVSWSNF